MDEKEFYKLAIEARDKLAENYHKWMMFYYVAIGSIFVAITNNSKEKLELLLVFSLIGIVISIFWNLSCKGYYYWSKSWITLILKHEKKLLKKSKDNLGVYSTFSHSVHNGLKSTLHPTSYANISTPKLTLIFSYLSIIVWLIYSIHLWLKISSNFHIFYVILIPIILIMLTIITHSLLLPKYAKSRNDDLHDFFYD